MRVRTLAAPAVGLVVAIALSGAAFVDSIQQVYAQAGAPEASHVAGEPVDVGDGWMVTVQIATLKPSAPPGGALVLVASLGVQNTGTVARHFPTYRLHLANSSGRMRTDTWCGRDEPSLELLPEIAAGGTGAGAACWTVDAADVGSLVLYLDPPLGQAEGRPVAFGLNPVARTQPAATPSAPALAAPAVGDPASAAIRPDPGAPAASSGRCSPAYSLYAGTSGGYMMPDCVVATGNGSSSGGSGAALRAAGVPACRLFPSGAQTNNATASSAPATPVPASAAAIPNQGGLAGVTC
jgi:hypothetical protein